MDNHHYILDDDHNVMPCDLQTWARWFETADRHVAKTEYEGHYVSTVFLGLDHRFGSSSKRLPPIVFETMVFAGKSSRDVYCDRYCTYAEAVEGHEKVVAALKAGTLEMY